MSRLTLLLSTSLALVLMMTIDVATAQKVTGDYSLTGNNTTKYQGNTFHTSLSGPAKVRKLKITVSLDDDNGDLSIIKLNLDKAIKNNKNKQKVDGSGSLKFKESSTGRITTGTIDASIKFTKKSNNRVRAKGSYDADATGGQYDGATFDGSIAGWRD